MLQARPDDDADAPPATAAGTVDRIAAAPAGHDDRIVALSHWATMQFGELAPDAQRLRDWTRRGYIRPQPFKQGARWFVSASASYQVAGD